MSHSTYKSAQLLKLDPAEPLLKFMCDITRERRMFLKELQTLEETYKHLLCSKTWGNFAIQFEMNTSHRGHKALPRLPQSTRRFRCSNKEEEEERSGKCIDFKKKLQWREAEKKRGKGKNREKQAETHAVWCTSCRGLLKNESKAHTNSKNLPTGNFWGLLSEPHTSEIEFSGT